jgi:uncharacterized membrane protein
MTKLGPTVQAARLLPLDLCRTAALLGMIVYHFTFDLQMFGLIAAGTAGSGWLYGLARIVAGSFLVFAGISLWLAHGQGFRRGAFVRRWLRVAGAAMLVTLATRLAVPDYYVFFGILHCMAACSLIGLLFLRLPAILTMLAAAAAMAAPGALAGPMFDAPLLRFLGLHTVPAQAVDFVPLLPWLGPFLAGLALARVADRAGLMAWAKRWSAQAPALLHRLAWPGRHTLAIYLLHQPVPFAVLWVWVVWLR